MIDNQHISSKISSAKDAASLILIMNNDNKKKVFSELTTEEISNLASLMAGLGKINISEITPMIERFSSTFQTAAPLVGSKSSTIELLSKALPKPLAETVLADLFGLEKSIWEKMQELSPQIVAEIFSHEHPQTIGYIVKHCDNTFAASLLDCLAEETRLQTVLAMIQAKDPPEKIRIILHDTIERKILEACGNKVNDKNVQSVADILNTMPISEAKKALEMIYARDPSTRKSLDAKIFSFDDLGILPTEVLKQVLETISGDKIAFALHNTSSEFSEVVLAGLGMRARRMVESELSSQSTPQQEDIANARSLIVDTVLRIKRESNKS